MVIVKYLYRRTGLAIERTSLAIERTGLANIPVSNIPVCLLKNVVKQVSQLFYPAKDHMIEKMKERPTQPKKERDRWTIGITVGKQAYRLLKYGRPFADFEVDLLLLAHANAKIGNLNHSRKFPSELRPVFAKVIEDRLMEYLAQPLDATSNLPPFGIVADKLTAYWTNACRYPVNTRHA